MEFSTANEKVQRIAQDAVCEDGELRERLLNRGLTQREAEVCQTFLECSKNQDIADRLFVDVKTIKYHLTNIFRKFSASNRMELLKLLFEIKNS